MRIELISQVGLGMCLLLAACHNTSPRADVPRVAPEARLINVTFHSTALNRDMPYRVFLPGQIQSGQKFPVVYLLHGGNGSYRDWSNYSDVSSYAGHGLILVMPEGAFSYYMNAVGKPEDRYEDYITQDLISDVEGRFPAASDPSRRAIVGISMGGFAALSYAFRRPDLFGYVAALSPPVDILHRHFSLRRWGEWWRIRAIFGTKGSDTRRARDPLVLVQDADPSKTPFVYLGVGTSEPLRDPVERFERRVAVRSLAHEFHEQSGGHDWGEWNRQLPDCFRSLSNHMEGALPSRQIVSSPKPGPVRR